MGLGCVGRGIAEMTLPLGVAPTAESNFQGLTDCCG